jgi:hypothetical protein
MTAQAPLWEFGFGLSYTTFKTEWLSTPQPSALKSYGASRDSQPYTIAHTHLPTTQHATHAHTRTRTRHMACSGEG